MPDEPLVSLPLWEQVKISIHNKYLITLDSLERADKDYSSGRAGRFRSRWESEFVSNVKGLYVMLAPKIGYPNKEEYKVLSELDAHVGNKKDTLDFEKAVSYFGLLRNLLEDLGITRTEQRASPEGRYGVEGLT